MKSEKKKPKILTPEEIFKYEIAQELGLLDKVSKTGWKSLTAKESGRLGGIMAKRRKQQRLAALMEEKTEQIKKEESMQGKEFPFEGRE